MKNPINAAEQITARAATQALLSEKLRAKSGAQSEIALSLTGPEYRAARRVAMAASAEVEVCLSVLLVHAILSLGKGGVA